jgi:hypothetical protein
MKIEITKGDNNPVSEFFSSPSKTPETDANIGFFDLETATDANFARKLERERDEARHKLELCMAANSDVARIAKERDEARELAKEADLGHDMAISDLRKCETELAEATTKLAEISSLTESIVEKANELIDRWDQPSWKDTAPTARFINALRIAVRAYERNLK